MRARYQEKLLLNINLTKLSQNQFVKEVKEDEHRVIKELFAVVDTEKKGKITPVQLRTIMKGTKIVVQFFNLKS